MNRTTHRNLIALTIVAGMAAPACQKANLAPSAGPPRLEPVSAPAPVVDPWTLRIDEGTAFVAASNGLFEIGPGPTGQKFDGELADDEVRELQSRIAEAKPCSDQGKPEAGVALKRRGVRTALCSEALQSSLRALATRYVPKPFPNPCVDAASALEKLHERARRCERDSDCAWIDERYEPLWNASSDGDDDCSWSRPIEVANAFETVALQRELVMARETTRLICHDQPQERPGCRRRIKERDPHLSPRCVRNRCRSPEPRKEFSE